MNCPNCGADLPEAAQFCIECGTSISPAPAANTGATTALPRSAVAGLLCPSCGAANPDHAVYCVRCGRPVAAAPQLDTPRGQAPLARPAAPPAPAGQPWEYAGFAVILIGMGLLFLLRAPFWPTILVPVGIGVFVQQALGGRLAEGLRVLMWLVGLAILFGTRLFWPGILVLVGLNILFDAIMHGVRRRP